MKYIKTPASDSERSLNIRIPGKVMDALDTLRDDVAAAGHKLDVQQLVADAIGKAVAKARKELAPILSQDVSKS